MNQFVECVPLFCFFTEAIPIPADQPIMQIKDLDEVVIPTAEIKVRSHGVFVFRDLPGQIVVAQTKPVLSVL